MATQVPTMAVCFVDATNNVLEDQGEAGSVIRRPSMVVHVVDSTGYIIEDDFAAGSVLGAQPAFAVVVVDSENHVIESDGDAGSVTRQMTTAFRQVGSGSPSMACVRIVDSSNTVLDELFGGGNRITLTDYSYPEDTAVNDVVAGILIDGAFDPAHHTFAISPSTTFDIWGGGDGDDLQLVGALNYEATTSYTIAITAYYDAVEIVTEDVTVYVTNVLEVTLNALTLNTDEIEEGSEEDTIVGALQSTTAGSTLSLTDDAGGRFKISGTNVVTGATVIDYDDATSYDITVRETHADGSNSPRDSVIAITVTEIGAATDAIYGSAALFGTWA
jgi:hypothetical protein